MPDLNRDEAERLLDELLDTREGFDRAAMGEDLHTDPRFDASDAVTAHTRARAAVLAAMTRAAPEGFVVVPKRAIEALYMRLWTRHEHLDDGPPDFEPVRQPWTPDDDAALKAVAKYLFDAPEAP